MPRKKRRAILISLIMIILIIIIIVGITLYTTTDIFKSNDILFEKYATQLLNNVDNMFNKDHMSEMEEILNNNKLTSEKTTMIKYNKKGDNSNPINNIQMNILGEEEKNTGYNYKDITVTQNDETLLGAEYIEQGNNVGVRLNGIKQYLSTNINNEENNEVLYNIYELIHTDILGLISFNSEEWNKLKEKYIGIVIQNLKNANFSKQTEIPLEINGLQYNTNVYSVMIKKEQFNNIYIKLLEELEKDETILSKMENIDYKINEFYNLKQDEKKINIKQNFIDKINKTIQKIQNSNIGNNERTISVFEANGVAISLSIDTEEKITKLYVINKEDNNYINLLGEEKIQEEEKENSFDLKVEKIKQINDEKINIQYNVVKEDKETTNQFSISNKMKNANVENIINFDRSVEQSSIEIKSETITKIVNNFEDKTELVENENNIIIEKLNNEQKENVKNKVNTNITNQINKLLEVISLEDINKILIDLNFMEEDLEDLSGGGSVTELEKNRFNSTFELFEGEHITKERVKELINIAKEDLKDIRITNYKEQKEEKIPLEYRLVIEKGTDSTELAESVIKYIEEKYKKEFSVKLEYDEKTGLVANIYITVMEN